MFIIWLRSFEETVGGYIPDEDAAILAYPNFEGVFLEFDMEMQHRQESSSFYSYECCCCFLMKLNIFVLGNPKVHKFAAKHGQVIRFEYWLGNSNQKRRNDKSFSDAKHRRFFLRNLN